MPCPARITGRLALWINSRACSYSFRVGREIGTVAGQLRLRGFPVEFAGGLLRVFGDVHQHRAGAPERAT